MQQRIETKLAGGAIQAPAGESAGHFLDILFGVMPHAESEQFHHFTREILVWVAAPIGGVVQIHNHRRVFRHRMQQLAKISQRLAAQQHMLAVHELCRFNLLLAGNEMVMPKQCHALGERRGRGEHFLIPPATQFHAAFNLLAL